MSLYSQLKELFPLHSDEIIEFYTNKYSSKTNGKKFAIEELLNSS